MKTKATTTAIILLLVMMNCGLSKGQDQGFIYGKVTTVDDRVYEGPLRWGKEEVFWTDMFNTAKLENENLQYLSSEDRRALEDRYHELYHDNHHSWFDAFVSHMEWGDDFDYTHQFVCQFGDIKSIKPFSGNRVDIVLQNGDKYEVSGEGYNDIGTDVQIIDPEIGEVKISWGRIASVEFMNGPNNFKKKFGEPLYGTVETYGGTFTGTIQWDHDERITTDVLDGDTRDGDVSIEFGNILSIERDGRNSSYVELKSGRKFDLDGSNDVDSGNRGIIVTTSWGRVDIPWDEFKKVTFTDNKPFVLKTYNDFKNQKALKGAVKSKKGDSYQGDIVYDLDEHKDYEVLQGEQDDIEYIIPFRNISNIVPKNYDYSEVKLRDGTKLLLGEGQDVSDKNTGLIVRRSGSNSHYILWDEIAEITFD